MGSPALARYGPRMDASASSTTSREVERERLERTHHEICTALTVFSSNVELVRIKLRSVPLPNDVPVHVHLDEIELAVDRLHEMARELKRWHDSTRLLVG